MLKKFSKFLLLVLLIFVVSSSSFVCLADETENTNSVTTTETNEETTTEPEFHDGDLYIFDDNIVMDKFVDGNVFIFGDNVEITGQVNGNLFVFANNIKFNGSLIRYSIYACANSVYYNGGTYESDLYIAANNIEMSYDSYVARDAKLISSNITFKAAVGRDVDLVCDKLEIGDSTENAALIYGDLRYTANKEISIPEGVMVGTGSVTYTPPSELDNNSIIDILISFLTAIITVLVIYAIIRKLTPSFAEKLSNEKLSVKKVLKAFGMGLLSIIIFAILFVILLITVIGSELAFILLALYIAICLISLPVLIIIIANILKPSLKIEKTSLFYLILVLLTIIIQGLTLIPYVGGVLSFIIGPTALGLLIDTFLPHKELTEEEKLAIEEAKKQAKEDKEKRKQEKLEAKAAKRQEKLEAKNNKNDTNL